MWLIIGTAALAIGSDARKSPDYAKASCWHKLPMIAKDVDTFSIYSTVYVDASFKEGAPDFVSLDNLEMLLGMQGEYVTNASVYKISGRSEIENKKPLYLSGLFLCFVDLMARIKPEYLKNVLVENSP